MDYDKNNKPIVKVPAQADPIRQYPTDLSPLEGYSSNSPFGEEVMPKNGGGDSGKLQKASRLPGRVGSGNAHSKLA